MPNLTEQAILPPPEHDAAVYRRLGRSEPLFGVYRRSVLSAAEALLEQGRGRMTDLLEAVETDYYYTPPCLEMVLQNLNTPADMLAARAGTPPHGGGDRLGQFGQDHLPAGADSRPDPARGSGGRGQARCPWL